MQLGKRENSVFPHGKGQGCFGFPMLGPLSMQGLDTHGEMILTGSARPSEQVEIWDLRTSMCVVFDL